MTPAERLPIAWSAFKALAIRVKGRLGAAVFLRECAELLEAEQRVAEEREGRARLAEPNVVNLAEFARR